MSEAINDGGPADSDRLLERAARAVLSASEEALRGCEVARWAGQENGLGEEFGVELDAALCAMRNALESTS